MCQIYETNEHATNDRLTLPSFKECLHEQAYVLNSFQRPNHNPYSHTYNFGWRDHLNFSLKRSNNNAQTSQPPFQAHYNFQNSYGYALRLGLFFFSFIYLFIYIHIQLETQCIFNPYNEF